MSVLAFRLRSEFMSAREVEDSFKRQSARLKIYVREKHLKLFLGRTYRSPQDIETALRRYRVFKDLGYSG